jgi:hypothetical protein
MFKLRKYQKDIANQGYTILQNNHILILNMEVRTGKTHIALKIASNYNNILFVTKKKAISSIEKDLKTAGYNYNFTIINYESLHKINGVFDLVIADESHSLSAYPKPSKRTKELKRLVDNDLILMTGTLTPESYSQIYHQLWISRFSPFKEYINFYKWHKHFGIPKMRYLGYAKVNDYSECKFNLIDDKIKHLKISLTQQEAGFNSDIKENILTVDMQQSTYKLIKKLKNDLVIEGKDEVILADTGVKLMSKIHQLFSGTVKFESGNSMIIDESKAIFIKKRFNNKKIAIFYKFKEEFNLIKKHLNVTQDIEDFNNSDKNIALQIVSGREGIRLDNADYIIYFNIDFSAVSYWQSRDRMTTLENNKNTVYWIFAKNGIEHKIYNAVKNKKDYTLNQFKKDERAAISSEVDKRIYEQGILCFEANKD